ncbi:MAG: (Fe-S)-binding protein [Chloroflexi bacterium]|nr:(Fe-S)-binding protein [Chloroflexota bacterium]
MLTLVERVLFLGLAFLSIAAAATAFRKMFLIIQRGDGHLHWQEIGRRTLRAVGILLTQRTTLRSRPLTSVIHLLLVWGFSFYFLVNLVDILLAYSLEWGEFLWRLGFFYDVFRLLADGLSAVVLVSASYFVLRRFLLPQRKELHFQENVLVHPRVKAGEIQRDSLVVAAFILLHVGGRLFGEAVHVAQTSVDPYMPFASAIALLFQGMEAEPLILLRHFFFWLAVGGILLFLPYFPHSKHAHLFMAPFNYLTQPPRKSPGALSALDFADERREQFGATRLENLEPSAIVDAFACIMCNRCQDVCPAYATGKELSPSAMEINKRYLIKDEFDRLANGQPSAPTLLGSVLSESALWACTACGACVDICPVGNEPMFDILAIRRSQVLMDGQFPNELQNAFNGMERQANPWQIAEAASTWSQGLAVPTVQENPDFEILFWTGCAVKYEESAQKSARALVKIMQSANVNFAVLGEEERCTGDVARRAGNEYLYEELARANVDQLNLLPKRRIVVTCPHCLHNLSNEYADFGGEYEVIHYTQLIAELIDQERLPPGDSGQSMANVTFHDPCYLGRQNGIMDEPRAALRHTGVNLVEMARNRKSSFCCGAGGAQFWKEEERGESAVNLARYQEAQSTGADTLAVGCPFCLRMLKDANQANPAGPAVKDVAEIVAERLPVQ